MIKIICYDINDCDDITKYGLFVGTICRIAKELNLSNSRIILISYEESISKDIDDIKEVLSLSNDEIVIILSYASKKAFPESKYFLNIGNSIYGANIDDKLPVPIKKVLEENRPILKSLGFENLNYYFCNEFSEPHIYTGNKYGKIIAENIRQIQDDFEKERSEEMNG